MREETKGRYEMLWDCPGCGTEKLLGVTHRHCPNCGAPQDPSKRYYPPDSEKIAVENHPYQGVDKACPACETANAAKAGFCVNCGSPLDEAKAVRTRSEQVGIEALKAGETVSDAKKDAEAARKAERERQLAAHGAASGAAPASGGGKGKFTLIAVAMVMMVLCGLCGIFFFWKKDAGFEVTGHHWERSIAIESLAPVQEQAWRSDMPADATNVSCQPEQKETVNVPDGEDCVDTREDKGDGSFEEKKVCTPRFREDPVYADKCSYTVTKWSATDSAKATGDSLTPAPAWPTVTLSNPGTCVGCQREGSKKESYTLTLKDASGAQKNCELPMDKWSTMAVGSRWTGEVGVVSGEVDCGSLRPAP
jgi:hypothetical protein